ncbi:hypothetical protein [Flavobacterium sp.]
MICQLAPIVAEINFVKVLNFDKVIVAESGKMDYKQSPKHSLQK